MRTATLSAFSAARDAAAVTQDLAAQLRAGGDAPPRVIVFFADVAYDGAAISRALHARFAGTVVVGCSSAGEFSDRRTGTGGVSALALGAGTVGRVSAALAKFDGGAARGIGAAAGAIARDLGCELRALDPKRHVGLVLFDGLHGAEEEANEALGNAAPLLSFVGGSAGDDLKFAETRVYLNGESTTHGAALVVMEMHVPFTIAKTCSFVPMTHRFTVTRADPASRTVYEVNGEPVIEAYARATGCTPATVGTDVFMKHPLGLMFDGQPWIRSPFQVTPDGGLKFFAQIGEGMEVYLMRSTDLVGETRNAIREAERTLGGSASGALLFNCILRRLELDAANAHQQFLETFAHIPSAGFHTYGETWLGHVNQTCTGLLFA